MAATTLTIDPVTRIEGHLSVDVKIDTVGGVQQVVDAWATGTLFRGFERLLVGRAPEDAQHLTQRICGVCPTPHGMAAVLALEKAYGVTPPDSARIMRNFVMGANFLQSHILHFYHLALLDFINASTMAPWQPNWSTDIRVGSAKAAALFANYVRAIDMNRKIQEMAAVFGGKLPHTPAFVAGGFTKAPTGGDIRAIKGYLAEVNSFIDTVYLADVEYIAGVYGDYFGQGRGHGNLLSFGAFALNGDQTAKLFQGGRVVAGSTAVETVDAAAIREETSRSWYAHDTDGLNPAAGDTMPLYPKADAYSWLKAPRYLGEPYEAGPLSRMWVAGEYRNGISVMDRHKARAREAQKISQAMAGWIDQIVVGQPVRVVYSPSRAANSYGLTEAPRGALGHWLEVSSGAIARYQVVTPTCWNASPRDKAGTPGPIEEALAGVPVQNINEPVEVLRVIHSFDPCMSCAVHVVRADGEKKSFRIRQVS